MRVYMKPVKMIALSEENGVITPLRFQMTSQESEQITVKVDNVVFRDEEKLAGNKMFIFRCQSIVNDTLKMFELKYEIGTCKWYLYKM